jgi:hypothetical protein
MSDQDTRLLSQLGQATLNRPRPTECQQRSSGPHSWAWDESSEVFRCLYCGRREAKETPVECDDPESVPQKGHHSRCHTVQYGSNESHCDCGAVPQRGDVE